MEGIDTTDTVLTESADPRVGMYVLGEPVNVGTTFPGYSRFTTSPSLPTWRVGGANPPMGNCAVGTIYSRTSSGPGTTTWACVASSTWHAIK